LNPEDFLNILPFLAPLAGAILILMADAFGRKDDYWLLGWVAFGIAALTAIWFFSFRTAEPIVVYQLLRLDALTVFSAFMISFCTAIAVLLSHEYLQRESIPPGPYYSLLLISSMGLILLAASNDWICFFISLEIASVPLYILSGIERRHPASREAAVKFFLMGAIASAFVLYGIAYIFGATGSASILPTGPLPAGFGSYLLIGAPVLMAGLCFKLGVAPMHFWVPDTFDGAPTPLVSFIATGSKVGVFAIVLRIFFSFSQPQMADAMPNMITLLMVISVASMILGNVLAVVQTQMKRLLAYSSIAHGGYMLMGLVVLTGKDGDFERGASAVMTYMAAYCFTSLAAFSVVVALGRKGDREISNYIGLENRQPWLARILALSLLSMIGIPLTVGFIGKYGIFLIAAQQGHYTLLVIALLTSVIAAYYYLKVLVAMYMKPEPGSADRLPTPGFRCALALGVTAAGVLMLGLMPNGLMTWIADCFKGALL
jgi:NADH-quinone oxidoreductase subunit N